MPGILFRHIFLELLKVLLVTTAVLGTVISFGAAIKPLSENILGPADLLKFMLFITVPMMQYALPFAAAFAGTVVYHRLTTDNEIVAMAASGMPYRRILLPAVAMGVLLTGVMVVLLDVGVPTFWQAAKRIFWDDGTRILAAKSGRGEAWRPPFSNAEIFADAAYIQDLAGDRVGDQAGGAAPGSTGREQAAMRLVLERVVALELGDDGMPKTEFTSQSAAVDQYRIADRAFLKIVLANATIFNRGEGRIARASIVRPEAISVPTFEQGPKGLTVRELLDARSNLAIFPAVALQRSRVLTQLDAIELWEQVSEALASSGTITFRGTGDDARMIYEVTASALREKDLFADEDRARGVVIRQFETGGADGGTRTQRREVHARRVRLNLAMLVGEQGGRFDLSAEKATVFDAHSTERGQSSLGRGLERPIRFSELVLEGASLEPHDSLSDDEVDTAVAAAHTTMAAPGFAGPAKELKDGLDRHATTLHQEMDKKSRDITARLVQRSAQSITPLLMLLNASILAVLLRQRTALLVYAVSFMPAILNIVMISGGEQMLRSEIGIVGFIVAYAGNVLLTGCLAAAAWLVRKH